MRPLRYSINVTLDGCVDHTEGLVPHHYEMMEVAWHVGATAPRSAAR